VDEVVVVYQSGRRLCPVAKGIIRGIGAHYDDPLAVSEESCMHEGADVCELVVTRA
jgi:predicted hydrocarbon binding protein